MNGIGYKIKKTILYILLILLSVVCMFPFLLMIVNATRSGSEIMKSFTLIPSVYLKENWATVFKYFNLFLGMWNSLKVAVPSTLLCAYFSAMTAYALAMYKFKGNKVLFMTILIFMMIPGQLGLIGFYNLCTKLHLVNSYIPLIIPAIASPGTVFFLRQYVLSRYATFTDRGSQNVCKLQKMQPSFTVWVLPSIIQVQRRYVSV